MTPKRILLMYISQVSGHRQATIALEQAIKSIEPQTMISNINAFQYTSPMTEQFVHGLYLGVLKRTPGVWDFLYDNPKIVRVSTRLKQFIHKHHAPKLKRLFDELKPDCIACTQAYPCGMIADFKKMYGIKTPLVAILTDYVPHSFWLYDNIDYYVCPHETIKERLIQKGIAGEKIKVLGIPIEPKFRIPRERQAACARLGLDPSCATVLVMGGGHGLGPIEKIVTSLDRNSLPMQILVVAGINTALTRWLDTNRQRFRKKITSFGFINTIEDLMAASQLIITKPGGITTAEALTMGLPMVIVAPLPGQEEHNTQFLLKLGAALLVKNPAATGSIVEGLLGNQRLIESMRQAARRLAHPDSAMAAGRLLLDLCTHG
jgi:processive 1,2-diacylglycerol beta-glucosyltransferase